MSEEKQVSIQEIAVSNMISIEALVRILVKRGFITKEEIVDEVKQVKLEQEAKRNLKRAATPGGRKKGVVKAKRGRPHNNMTGNEKQRFPISQSFNMAYLRKN